MTGSQCVQLIADMPQQQLQGGGCSPRPTAGRLPPTAPAARFLACRVRFDRPYLHPMRLPGQEGETKLTVHQARFTEQGFASTGERLELRWQLLAALLPSTLDAPVKCPSLPARLFLQQCAPPRAVWDSSIVLAKFIEAQGAPRFAGTRCLDLSAGCGLPGLVLAKLGAAVTATDLAPNLPLLEKNSAANGERRGRHRAAHCSARCVSLHPPPPLPPPPPPPTLPPVAHAAAPVPAAGCGIAVREHSWGGEVAHLEPPFDFILACDLMYICELVQPLVASLVALSGPSTHIYIAHGRNRQVGGAAVCVCVGGGGGGGGIKSAGSSLGTRLESSCPAFLGPHRRLPPSSRDLHRRIPSLPWQQSSTLPSRLCHLKS